ncbi:MAG: glycosyltransferase family 1 protein [Bacteroidia bacterium]|nr:glycosyltransferase family 1 protein [Bacteroidia bacterium]
MNTRFLLTPPLEGIGRFTQNVLQQWVKNHPNVEFYFFFDRPYRPEYLYAPNIIPIVLFPPARHPLLYIAFFEGATYYQLKKIQPNVFFSPDGYLCLRSNIPQVAVFHDLAFEHFPQGISKLHLLHYRYFFPRYAQKAKRICCVSQYTANDIHQTYNTPQEKLKVVYNGASPLFQPLEPQKQQQIRNQYTQGAPFFLSVGAIHPRKNLERLLQAFDIFKENTHLPIKLLIIGRKAWNFENVIKCYQKMHYQKDVIFTGSISDTELAKLYASALALCYVSLFEGFGLPLLEAMQTHTAILTSKVTSMPEIANGAALLVDPYDTTDIAQGLIELATNPNLRSQLISAAQKQKQKFSWEKTAALCWQAIEEAIST